MSGPNAPAAIGQQRYILDRCDEDTDTGCWTWNLRTMANGYGQACSVTLTPRVRTAHRVSYEAFIGPIPEGMCVLHKCDRRACVNPDHLFTGTKKDNTLDMMRKGRRTQTVLTPELVAEIRESSESSRAIGRRLNYDAGNIRSIRRGKLWPI